MKVSKNRDEFIAENKLEGLLLEKIWRACYAARMEGYDWLYLPKGQHLESDREKALQIMKEYGYTLP